MTDVAKCSEGMAASGLPPRTLYRGSQPSFQNCSPYSTIIRRIGDVAASPSRPVQRRVPGRRRRHAPVADQPEVEHRVGQRRAVRGKRSGWRSST